MRSEDRRFVEELIRSAAEPPRATVGFRKRVLRAARRAEKDRAAQQRLRLALCLSGIAALAMFALGPFLLSWAGLEPNLGGSAGAAVGPSTEGSEEADWNLVDSYKNARSVHAGVMRGSR